MEALLPNLFLKTPTIMKTTIKDNFGINAYIKPER